GSTVSTGSASSGTGVSSAAAESTVSAETSSSSEAGAIGTGARSIMIATGAPRSTAGAGGCCMIHQAALAWAATASAAALDQRRSWPSETLATCFDQAMSGLPL